MIDILVKCIKASPELTKLRKLLNSKQIRPKSFVIIIHKKTHKCFIHELNTSIMPTSAKHTCPIFKPSLIFPKDHKNYVFINLSTRSRSCARRIGKSEDDIYQCIPTNVDIIGDLDASREGKSIYSSILGPNYVSVYYLKPNSINNIKNRADLENKITKQWKLFLSLDNTDIDDISSTIEDYYKIIEIHIAKL